MSFRRFAVRMALGLCATIESVSAVVITYDADVAPDALSPDPFSFEDSYSTTSWSVGGGNLTLNTTLGNAGIWFGNGDHVPALAVPWDIGTSEQGNYVKIRMRLAPGSQTWSTYLLDQSHNAGFTFNHDSFTWSGGSGMTLDLTEFHTFEFLLKEGVATFRLDESVVLGEVALNPSPFGNGILVIGDGSVSTVSGSGSMIIDHVTYTSSPAFSIPETGTAGLLCLGAVAMTRRRVRRCRGQNPSAE